jgi:putative salt-induced outer membrane protein
MKVLFIMLMLSFSAHAQEAPATEKKFKGESEASTVVVSGNTNSETYGAKTKNTYSFSELDAVSIFGKLLKTKTAGVETASAWEFGARYERTFTKDILSGFLQHKAEHDPYNGVFIQRDSTDLGLKYILTKSDDFNWLAEAGLRSSKVYTGATNETLSFARLYTEMVYKISATSSTKFWAELLPNFKRPDEYQYNAELSLSVTISTMFSLKTAILLNHNHAILEPQKKDTTTWTTALVASY